MTAVQLDVVLGLEAFRASAAAAEGILLGLKSKTDSGLTLKTFLDTSTLSNQLAAAQKALSANTTVKVSTDFYKTGSQYAISASKLKSQFIDPIQQKVKEDRKYIIKIGTELAFDQSSIKQIDQIIAKAKASLAPTASQPNVGGLRQQLKDLTKNPGQDGLDAKGLQRLKAAAVEAGIEISGTTAAELRKEMPAAFAKVADESILGLSRDLASGKTQVAAAGSKLAKSLLKSLRKDLGIASPSKETGKLGRFSADGFGQGFVGGMVAWERQMAGAIRQAIGNAFQQGLSRDAAARGALADMGRDAGAVLSQSLAKSLKQGLASSVVPALKGALLGGAGGAATGGVVGGLAAAGSAIQQAASPAMLEFGYGSVPQKLGMLGHGAASLASGGASDAFNALLQQSVDAVVNAAMSSGSQGAMLGAAGVAGVAGIAGLAKGAGGSLVSQAVESIKNRILGTAVQEAQAQAQLPGSTAGAVSAPVENASNVMGGLKTAVGTVARGLLDFAKGLTPGALQQRIIDIAWNIDQAAEQFGVLKKDTQVLAGKVRNTWSAFSNNTPAQLLPPQPVAGTGLMRQEGMVLGNVVGRTAFDFRGPAYGTEGNRIGPADIGEGRGYIEQTRNTLQAIAGRPGEWKIVEEVNGVWQRIKSDSELAEERLALITESLTKKANQSYRTWTDWQGVGTFNPFEQPFYRPTRPPQAPPTAGDSNFGPTGPNRFGSDGSGGGGGGNRFGTPNPAGALALRNVPVELFTSFKEAERLLALVEQRLAAVGKAFDNLKVKSQVQVDQEVRKLAVSLRAAELAFQKGEISARDMQAANYGAAREMAGLGAQTAQVQNLAQAFENLGVQSTEAYRAIQSQRNIDLNYVLDQIPADPNDTDRRSDRNRARNLAVNARDAQALQAANDAIRSAQSNSGFGGFRGREIGNDELNKARQRSSLAIDVDQLYEQRGAVGLTGQNAETQRRVLAAYTEEIGNAERALRVLNGEARAGETATHMARNAWGTILDDFQNLVPQLLVFAVAYNLIIQRVLTTPGAVIQAAAAFDRLETSISAYLSATRGIGDASGTIQELQQVALDLGIGFEKAAGSYLRFAAATQYTPLEGREVEITRTLATAGRNQGLGGEQIDRASVALTQILSKGRVQSEELRGQLAEQLPGALQVAARAFGVTTKELYRMVEAGQIAGDEFVGRFMQQLRAEGASTNQLAGSFSNVSEQLGSSIQTMAAAAGQPFLTPLTLGLQGVNALIQVLIPAAPVLTGLFVVLGAQALRSALGVKSLSAELLGVVRNLFASRNAAEGYTAGLVKLTGVARVAATALATIGKAALIGLAFEAVAGTIRYLKGEVGALGDELKKVIKIAEGGEGQGLNGLQKLLGNLNVAQNFSDRTTFFDAAKIGESSDQATGKILANQKRIGSSIKEVNRIDRQLYAERVRRDQAEANKDEQGTKRSIERIKELEKQRNAVSFDVSPEDAQIQLGALKAAEQAVGKLIERQKALGDKKPFVEEQQLERLRKIREGFEKAAKAAGLLDQSLLKVQSLGALQSRLKANQEILPTLDVNSAAFRAQQVLVAGLQQGVTDQQLLPQERALKTQEMVLRRMSTELKVQENIQRIKLGLVENERKAIEASLGLERTRGQLREAVAQRRVDVAGALSVPEEQLAAEAQLRRVREGNQAKELQMQGRLLGKDRERVGIETSLQKEQIKLQTQQLAIDKQMLAIERLKMEAAAKQSGISADLRRSYYLQLGQIDKTIAATNTLIGQEGSLLRSVDQKGAAELSVLGIKQQELDVERQILGARSLTAQQVEQIKEAQQDIANNEADALSKLQAVNKALETQKQTVEGQLDAVRATVEAQRERARLAEETAAAEMGLLDRLLELQQGRNDGGFFERMAKASLLGASGEQEAYAIAERRAQLQREIQQQQLSQKRLDLALKKQELEAEKALNALKLQGLKIANEEAKVGLRAKLEKSRLTLEQLGGKRTAAQTGFYKQVTDAQLALDGYNPPAQGNSVNNQVSDTLRESQSVFGQDRFIAKLEQNQNKTYGERKAALDNLITNEEKMLGIQRQLFELDAAQWFGQFLDKSTQLGRTLGVVTTGLSEFRSTVSQAFSDAITNGANASEAIADAGQALAGKFTTGLLDELVLKPMEANLFKGLAQVFGFEKPQSEQQATAANTAQTKQAVNEVNTSVQLLQGEIREGAAAVVAAINGIAKPTTATPVYRAPENAGMSGAVAAIGGIANMLPGTKGGPNINEGVGARGGRHKGQDLGLDPGDPIHARMSGVVTSIIENFGKVGKAVVMRYANGQEGRYGHVNPSVGVGDPIAAGQKIATVTTHIKADGSNNTHLHYELRDGFGKLLDPLNAIKQSLKMPAGGAQAARALPAAVATPATMSALPMSLQFDSVMDTASGKPIPVTVVPFGGSGTGTLDQAGALTNSAMPALSAATSDDLGQLSNDASQLSSSLVGLNSLSQDAMASFTSMDASFWAAAGSMNEVAGAATKAPTMFSQLSTAIGAATQALAGIGMISGGVGMMQGGGTYNTLMGLAGIFGGIASVTGSLGSLGGMFGGGGGGGGGGTPSWGDSFNTNLTQTQGINPLPTNFNIPGRAVGGSVVARKPYKVQETGFELFVPQGNGTVLSNSRSKALLEARSAIAKTTPDTADSSDYFAASRDALNYSSGMTKERNTERALTTSLDTSNKPLDIRYQSEVINQTEYVSVDQFQRGMTEAAERGRGLTLSALKNSVRARRQVGV